MCVGGGGGGGGWGRGGWWGGRQQQRLLLGGEQLAVPAACCCWPCPPPAAAGPVHPPHPLTYSRCAALQVGESEPFISELLTGLTATIQDLETHQIHMFYEAVGLMVSADTGGSRWVGAGGWRGQCSVV